MSAYWKNIGSAFGTLWGGLKLTFRHILQARHQQKPKGIHQEDYFKEDTGLVTVQYPHESFPVPDNGRYRLHNEIDDCIVCDKCAKICPVDCIHIDPIKAVGEIGKTSDGTSKRIHAARFDIDMGLCCFCGLCTTVCPTECLTMTKTYDFSEYDVEDHVYSFATMTPLEILEKRKELEEFEQQKAEQKNKANQSNIAKPKIAKPKTTGAKPQFKPKVKPVPGKPEGQSRPVIKNKKKGEGDD